MPHLAAYCGRDVVFGDTTPLLCQYLNSHLYGGKVIKLYKWLVRYVVHVIVANPIRWGRHLVYRLLGFVASL